MFSNFNEIGFAKISKFDEFLLPLVPNKLPDWIALTPRTDAEVSNCSICVASTVFYTVMFNI